MISNQQNDSISLVLDNGKYTSTTDNYSNDFYVYPIIEDHLLYFGTDLPLTIYTKKIEEGYWIVSSLDLDTYGVGDNKTDAITNFISVLFDYYQELLNEEEILGPHLISELTKLRLYLG